MKSRILNPLDHENIDRAIEIIESAMQEKYPLLRREIRALQSKVFVYNLPDNPAFVATAVAYLTGKNAHLRFIAVDPRYQDRGIGRILLDDVEQWAKKNLAETLDLTDSIKSKEKANWYERRGYTREGSFSRVKVLE